MQNSGNNKNYQFIFLFISRLSLNIKQNLTTKPKQKDTKMYETGIYHTKMYYIDSFTGVNPRTELIKNISSAASKS